MIQHILLNGRRMTSRDELFIHIMEKFDLPEHFGGNLDALWDVLSTHDRPTAIFLVYTDDMVEALGGYGVKVIELFRDLNRIRRGCSFYIVNEDPERLSQPRYWE